MIAGPPIHATTRKSTVMINRHDADPDGTATRTAAAGWAVTGTGLAHILAMGWTTAALFGIATASLFAASFTTARAIYIRR